MIYENTQSKKELNNLRHFDANSNKYKEDIKYDNFKKNVIDKHTRQSLQV